MEYNRVYNEDCMETMDRMEDNSVDLVLTSPPYNVDLGNNKYNDRPYDLYDDNKDHDDYLRWLRNIFSRAYEKTVSGGRCVINVGDAKNGRIPTHSDIIQMMIHDIGWLINSTIVWNKSDMSNRCAWGSFQSASCPSFPRPLEFILIFSKDTYKKESNKESDVTKQEFIDWSLALWEFSPENKAQKIGHPAPFPEELPKRCMKMLSFPEDLIYDPFMGSGTTALVAEKLDRNWVGSEISEEYCNIVKKRIKDYKRQHSLF